jgi:hypothetical protein
MRRATVTVLLAFAAFVAGAAWGSHDRTCVTATAPNGATVVYCSTGTPTGDTHR